jgi:hypothetical protein
MPTPYLLAQSLLPSARAERCRSQPIASSWGIRAAPDQTLTIVGALSEAQLARTGRFGGYGTLTVRGLLHYLCSHDQQHLAGLQWLLGKIDAERMA